MSMHGSALISRMIVIVQIVTIYKSIAQDHIY